jgi:hypothetical protein
MRRSITQPRATRSSIASSPGRTGSTIIEREKLLRVPSCTALARIRRISLCRGPRAGYPQDGKASSTSNHTHPRKRRERPGTPLETEVAIMTLLMPLGTFLPSLRPSLLHHVRQPLSTCRGEMVAFPLAAYRSVGRSVPPYTGIGGPTVKYGNGSTQSVSFSLQFCYDSSGIQDASSSSLPICRL